MAPARTRFARSRPARPPAAAAGRRAASRRSLTADLSVRHLVERLAAADEFGACASPYRESDEDPLLDRPRAAATRRANLEAYLARRRAARCVLVGEAMGYRGGRFSGVAFTAERQLDAWGAPYGRTSTSPAGWAEPSATIIHGALEEVGREHDVVLWNSVPAHPYRPGRPLSNRLPTAAEVRAGLPYLDLLLDLLRPEQVVAVGRVAERLLGDRATAAVRHPAQGGATACRAGLRALLH